MRYLLSLLSTLNQHWNALKTLAFHDIWDRQESITTSYFIFSISLLSQFVFLCVYTFSIIYITIRIKYIFLYEGSWYFMKTLKVFYYRMKQKNAHSYFCYWHKKALANITDIEKWRACCYHMMYWISKMVDYNAAIHKELGS